MSQCFVFFVYTWKPTRSTGVPELKQCIRQRAEWSKHQLLAPGVMCDVLTASSDARGHKMWRMRRAKCCSQMLVLKTVAPLNCWSNYVSNELQELSLIYYQFQTFTHFCMIRYQDWECDCCCCDGGWLFLCFHISWSLQLTADGSVMILEFYYFSYNWYSFSGLSASVLYMKIQYNTVICNYQ
jgi:hypothetical protein